MCQCLIFLEEPLEVANVLEKLSRGSSADALMAYQVHFGHIALLIARNDFQKIAKS